MELHYTVSREPMWFDSLPLRPVEHRTISSRSSGQLADSPSHYTNRPLTRRTNQRHKNIHWNIFSCMWNLHVCVGQVEIMSYKLLVQVKALLFAGNQ